MFESKSTDLQHCSRCGETCNPGTGMTVDGNRFHKDACPVINHAARAAAGQRLKKARLRALGNSQTQRTGILEQVRPDISPIEADSQEQYIQYNGGAMA